ncbi:MAG: type ISP restriction/modification enzyme, partial [Flammeovirgaceae bacterium]
MGYIYGVLHSPTFRMRYQELLKIDFPRIPFVEDSIQFEQIAALGLELVQVHLMKTDPAGVKPTLQGAGDNQVKDVKYDATTQQLHINETQYFIDIPSVAWDFTIGGYQVLDKYLKERKKVQRPLGLTELKHIPKVVRILVWTHQQMQK